jgi:alkanesulfonate monooxygenase SsuD/methylene tetrahydromethanopterin reductase-like flavin-dependent oxidoreductase (luciferase family)
MKIGMNYRNWGPYATRENLLSCARIADESTLDSIWVNDHIGFPTGNWNNEYGISDDMGTIIDPYAIMAFLGAVTSRIEFGSAVIIGPYRPPLPTAKWLQSIQLLSDERMLFGVGPGYLTEEFTALGVDKRKRGKLTDELLDLLHKAFADDSVECNGQSLILKPQPKRPPFIIGGGPNIAIPRAIKRGDGWMPVSFMPNDLKPHVDDMNKQAADAGRGRLEVVAMKTLPLDDLSAAIELAQGYRDAGATHLVHTQSYDSPAQYQELVDIVSREIRPAVQ